MVPLKVDIIHLAGKEGILEPTDLFLCVKKNLPSGHCCLENYSYHEFLTSKRHVTTPQHQFDVGPHKRIQKHEWRFRRNYCQVVMPHVMRLESHTCMAPKVGFFRPRNCVSLAACRSSRTGSVHIWPCVAVLCQIVVSHWWRIRGGSCTAGKT